MNVSRRKFLGILGFSVAAPKIIIDVLSAEKAPKLKMQICPFLTDSDVWYLQKPTTLIVPPGLYNQAVQILQYS